MAARAYWKGSLKLSLVTCPVMLYPATTTAAKIRFHMITPPRQKIAPIHSAPSQGRLNSQFEILEGALRRPKHHGRT